MSLPAVVFYGNCQAQHLGDCFRNLPGAGHRYRIETVLNVVVPGGPEMVSPPQDRLDRCEVLFLQVETKRDDPEFVTQLAARGATIVRFPAVACPPLWPQQCIDDRNYSAFETRYPFGRYPYGDRVLLDLMQQGLTEDEILDGYLAADVASLFQVERVLDYWRCGLSALDARSDIKIASFLETALPARRLFYTSNHPTAEVIDFLLGEILRIAWGRGTPDSHVRFAADMAMDQYMQPVHPSIARALHLKWWSEDILHRHWENGRFTHREFARRYLRYAG